MPKIGLNRTIWVIGILIMAILIIGSFNYYLTESPNQSPKLQLKEQAIEVEVADENTERQRGLSGRNRLRDNQGMLFVFDQVGRHGIWMKDMKFALDIIWLDSQLKITDIATNISPSTYPAQTFFPGQPAKYVLEVNAGTIAQHGWQIGDQAQWQ